jgi:Arc/MetJ-type ribon-helix-helix transcriptional regulator
MKVSVSLPEGDVEFLDAYARSHGYDSRSAVLHKAVGLLRSADLADAAGRPADRTGPGSASTPGALGRVS